MQLIDQNKLLDDLCNLFAQNHQGTLPENRENIAKILEQHFKATVLTETKHVTILLSDLRGFTALSEKYSPLLVVEVLNRYFSKMTEIIDQYGGVIDKFMGDSIMVLFGSFGPKSSNLHSAIECAIQMQSAMTEINIMCKRLRIEDLFMGIGINTGEVVAGTLGSEIYQEYTVIGDQVNLVSRVESQSLRGQILLTENSYKFARDLIEVGQVSEVHVKGKKDPVKIYELKALNSPKRMEVPQREVRKSQRVLAHIPIKIQLVDARKKVTSEIINGIAIDISTGGIYARSDYPLTAFDEVKLELQLGGEIEQCSNIYARIIKSQQFGDKFDIHFEFTAIENQCKEALSDYIAQIT